MKPSGLIDISIPPYRNHSVEEVVAIGAQLQREMQQLFSPETTTPTYSGNWKSSLVQHALLLSSTLIQETTPTKIIGSLPQRISRIFNWATPWKEVYNSTKSSSATLQAIFTTRPEINSFNGRYKARRKRSPKEKKTPPKGYDLTSKNIEEQLKLKPESLQEGRQLSQQIEEKLVKLKRSISNFLDLDECNSHEGVELLSQQSKLLRDIQVSIGAPEDVVKAAKSQIESLQKVYANFKVNLDPHIHGIWVAGSPPESLSKYVKIFLNLFPNFDFTLWVDSNAMGAAKFAGLLKQIAFDHACLKLQKTTHPELKAFIDSYYEQSAKRHHSRDFSQLSQQYHRLSADLRHVFYSQLLQNRIVLQDNFFNFCSLRGIKEIDDAARSEYLRSLGFPEEVVTNFDTIVSQNKAKVEELKVSLGSEIKFKIEDIKVLDGLKKSANYYSYQKEMLLRWNFAAATDIIRLFILQERGGIYTDTDMLPAFSAEVRSKIQSEGQKKFFENHDARRVLAAAGLAIATGEKADISEIVKEINAKTLSSDDQSKLTNICIEMERLQKESDQGPSKLFQPIDTQVVRDTMPVLRRYQKIGSYWQTIPLNGFMIAHKDSAMVDAVIYGVIQAHRELEALRAAVREGEFFKTIGEIVRRPPETLLGDFEVQDFLIGSTFSNFRQDTIIPQAMSTLDISGPWIVERQEVDFFAKLGPLAELFLNGNRLSDEAFIGTFTRQGESFDWENPAIVGVNDVTPDDASTWCISEACVKTLLSKELAEKVTLPDQVVKTRVNVDDFAKLWSPSSRQALEKSGILADFNALIDKAPVPLEELKQLDQKIAKLAEEISAGKNRLDIGVEKTSIFSLQMQLAELVRSTRYPVENRIHFSPNFHQDIEVDLNWSMRMFLTSDPETRVTVWYSETRERSVFLRELLSCGERVQYIYSLIEDIKSNHSYYSGITSTLETYLTLKIKEHLGQLKSSEVDTLLSITTQLAEAGLWGTLQHIEYDITSRPVQEKAKRISNKSFEELASSVQKESLTKLFASSNKDYAEKMRPVYEKAWEERVEAPQKKFEKLKQLYRKDSRVNFKNPEKLQKASLLQRLHKEGYAFVDLAEIENHLLIGQGFSGIFAESNVVPAPTENLVSTLQDFVKEGPETIADYLPKAYDFVLYPEDPHIPKELVASLSKLPKEQLLVPPVVQSVSQFGVGYGTEGWGNSGRVMVGIAPGFENPGARVLESYLQVLYDLHTELRKGTADAKTFFSRIQEIGADKLVQKVWLDDLCSGSKQYLSLTEIHSALTSQRSLADAVMPLLSHDFPGIGKLFSRDVDYRRPTATTITNAAVVDSKFFKSVGFSKNLMTSAFPSVTYHVIAEQAKYRLLTWESFYNEHVSLWSERAGDFFAQRVYFHPQSMIFSDRGRCLGLTLLYMQAGASSESYRTIQQNLAIMSSLFQQQERDRLPISVEDQNFLRKNMALIEWLQHAQNLRITSPGLLKLKWEPEALTKMLSEKTSLLVTTPSHSLLIQLMDSGMYRVTDVNFGHADFKEVREALFFTENAVQVTDTVRKRYGLNNVGAKIRDEISVYPLTSETKHWLSINAGDLVSSVYVPTRDRLSPVDKVTIGDASVPIRLLHDMGGMVNGNRISVSFTAEDAQNVKLNGHILSEFLETTHLSHDTAEVVRKAMLCMEYEDGTPHISPEKAFGTTYENRFIIDKWKQQSRNLRNMILGFFDVIATNLRKHSVSSQHSKLNSVSLDHETETFHVEVESLDGKKAKFTVKDRGILSQFRVLNSLLSDVASSGGLDFEIGLSVVSLIQYFRMVQEGHGGSPLAKINLFLDIKSLAEITFGSFVQVASKRFFSNEGIQTFRLESHIAEALKRSGQRLGGSVGKALKSAAYILELPILETIVGVWNIYDSIVTLQSSTSYPEIVSAQVQIIFDSVTLALTAASVVAPPLIMAVGPIAAIGMGASAIAKNVAHKEMLHEKWLEYKKFLTLAAKNVYTAYPEEGLLDFSQNQVFGNLYLDLRQDPPVLKGSSSHNWSRKLGNRPHLSDREIRYLIGYANSISPGYALAKGFANSLWPQSVDPIPKGKYETVLLGYGITYRAYTQIEYLSNRIVWREAVIEKQETLKPLYTNSTIIAGDRPLKVIALRLFSPNSATEENAQSLRSYTITLSGGPAGLMVQVGGAGVYKIKTSPGTDNTLSFRAMPDKFSLRFNLSEPVQKILWKSQIPLMEIHQQGVNVLVGSMMGEDHLVGNCSSTFYASRGGGTIHSGLGNVSYHIPRLKKNLSIFLTEGSAHHNLRTDLLLYDLAPPQNTWNLSAISQGLGGIYFYTKENWTQYLNRLTVFLGDGFRLTPIEYHNDSVSSQSNESISSGETYTWKVIEGDQETWQVHHPDEKSYPENIIDWVYNLGWSFAKTFTLILRKALVQYTEQTNYLVYRLFSSYTELRIPGSNRYHTEIYGSAGSRYILSAQATSSFNISLAGEHNAPETVDFSRLMLHNVYGTLANSESTLKLNVSLAKYSFPVEISSKQKNLSLKTLIILTKYRRLLLEDIVAALLKRIGTQVQIFQKELDYARVDKDILYMNRTVTWIPANTATNDSIILRLRNAVPVNKQVCMKVLSGKFVGIRKSDQNYRYLIFPQQVNNTQPVAHLNASIPGYSYRHIEFKPQENVLFFSEVKANTLRIIESTVNRIKRIYWEPQDHITIEVPAGLYLEGFKEYLIGEDSLLLTRLLMYHQGNLQVREKDLFIRLFYYRERRGVGSLAITFKNFFSVVHGKNDDPSLDQATRPIINPEYQDFLTLQLGSDKVSLSLLVSDINSMHRLILSAQKTAKGHWVVPEKYWDLAVALLVGNIERSVSQKSPLSVEDDQWLDIIEAQDNHIPLITSPQASYQLNDRGDLFLTRLAFSPYKTRALVLTFESYRDNWESYQHQSVSLPHFGDWHSTETVLHFNGPEIWHAQVELPWRTLSGPWHEGGLVFLSRTTFLRNERLIHYDPSYATPRCKTKNACILWDLEERANYSERSQMYDSRIMELSMKYNKWEVPHDLLRYALGYLHVNLPWEKAAKLQVDSVIQANAYHTLYIFLTTSQNGVFERSGEDYDIYYAFNDLHLIAVIDEQTIGDTRCRIIDKAPKFKVVAVRQDVLKKCLFVVLKPVFVYSKTLEEDYFSSGKERLIRRTTTTPSHREL